MYCLTGYAAGSTIGPSRFHKACVGVTNQLDEIEKGWVRLGRKPTCHERTANGREPHSRLLCNTRSAPARIWPESHSTRLVIDHSRRRDI